MPNSPSQPAQAQPAPAQPGNINVAPNNPHAVAAFSLDTALDATTALFKSDFAPLQNVSPDHKAVWACVPSDATLDSPEVWLYFHGHNNFVTAKVANGSVGRYLPDWPQRSTTTGAKYVYQSSTGRIKANFDVTAAEIPNDQTTSLVFANRQGAAQQKNSTPVMGVYYEFTLLSASLAPNHVPIVLAPEDGVDDPLFDIGSSPQFTIDPTTKQPKKDATGSFVALRDSGGVKWTQIHSPWSVESAGTMSTLDSMVDDCLKKLQALNKQGSTTDKYLSRNIGVANLKRFYLTGHSGGGVPLYAACSQVGQLANLKSIPTTVVSYDSVYNDYSSQLKAFLQAAKSGPGIGLGKSQCRVVIVAPLGGTDNDTKRYLVPAIASVFPGGSTNVPDPQIYAWVEYQGTTQAGTPLVHHRQPIPELTTHPIVIIHSNNSKVPHDFIPQHFTSMILTASP
jgi:hypothetical protein